MKRSRRYPKKRLGQHFLRDDNVIRRILESADLSSRNHILEIGPGDGALTKRLLETGAEICAVEIDGDLASDLRHRYPDRHRLKLIEGDILKIGWPDLFNPSKTNKIVANLPYHISSPVFFKMAEYRRTFQSAVIMVQKEFGQRLRHPGPPQRPLKAYGILSVVAAVTFEVVWVCDVAPACFRPKPEVESMVLRLEPKTDDPLLDAAFFRFVQEMFGNRRKLLLSNMRQRLPNIFETLSAADRSMLAGLRAENLSPDTFRRLFLAYRGSDSPYSKTSAKTSEKS